MRLAPLLALILLACPCSAQTTATNAGGANLTKPAPDNAKPAPVKTNHSASTVQLQASLDQLTQSNHDLLDLLKKQQAVLEDIQFDRRLQSRQIQSLEERLEEALLQNGQLQSKVANLEAAAAVGPATAAPAFQATGIASTNATTAQPEQVPDANAPPATYLPAPETGGMAGAKWWHRLFTLKGTDGKNSDLFKIEGHTWRVVWHNQDKPGKAYQNTSALFINAFPKDDTIPQKICSKLGSGGDSTNLEGPGNYYLKIEASGGTWELAVEDLR
jgi:hypothetical protein